MISDDPMSHFHTDHSSLVAPVAIGEWPVRGIIFDLDGTLVDSALDFEVIRRDMGLPAGSPILEALNEIPAGAEKERLLDVLRSHELRGAERAVLFDGVPRFLEWLDQHGLYRAILTRNSRESTDLVLRRLAIPFTQVLTREDAPPKPDPTGLLHICRVWGLYPAEVLFCGDYLFDLEAGSRAGMRTILFAPRESPAYASQATVVLKHFRDAATLIERHFVVEGMV